MSYILDALKRADAERGRGAVPGLHTRQLANPSERNPAAPGTRSALWLGLAGALALAGIGGGLWLWQKPAQAPVTLVLPPVVVATPASPALAPVAAIAPGVSPALPAAPAVSVAAARVPAMPALIAPEPALPVPSARTKAKPALMPAAPSAATQLPVPAPSQTTAPAAPAALAAPVNATQAAVPLLSELPDELRSQVPAITITGAVYAVNPGQRLLLVNNLVLTQGALAAPELKLEEIQPRSSVFNFRGTRFRVGH